MYQELFQQTKILIKTLTYHKICFKKTVQDKLSLKRN